MLRCQSPDRRERRSPLAITVVLGIVFAFSSCVRQFHTVSEYTVASYLCDDQEAYAARIDDCREKNERGEICAGVVSLTGSLDGEPLTITETLDEALLEYMDENPSNDTNGGGLKPTNSLHAIELKMTAPYFSLVLGFQDLGTSIGPDPRTAEYVLDNVASNRQTLDPTLGDGFADFEAGGETERSQATTGTPGALLLSRYSLTAAEGQFFAAYQPHDVNFTGCFAAFFTKRTPR